jgi:hypothetical protein
MLAELAAANAAYNTIKKFVVNGKEVSDFLAPLKNLVGAEEELRARGNRKSSGIFAKIMGKTGSDFDEFMALEKLAEQRKELESLCRLYAKSGTWDKFIAFESKMRVERKKEAEARQKQIAQIIKYATWGIAATLTLGGIVVLYFFTEFLKDLR